MIQHSEDATEKVSVSIELGRLRVAVDELESFDSDILVCLEQKATEPLDVLVGDRLIARGEIGVIGDKFCIHVTELVEHVDAVV